MDADFSTLFLPFFYPFSTKWGNLCYDAFEAIMMRIFKRRV